MQLRIALVTLGLLVLFGFVMHRMYSLQIEDEELEARGERQLSGSIKVGAGGENHLDGHRGFILDRNGKELAISVEVASIYAHPKQLTEPDKTIELLSELLELSPETLRSKLESNASFVWLARKVNPAIGDRVRELRIPGLGVKRESKRYYPAQDLAGPIIGFSGMDNTGLDGLEATLDSQLRGSTIELKGMRDARGHILLHLDSPRLNHLGGNNVVLSLDERIQRIAESAIERSAVEFRAKSAIAVVMDPHSGDLLALATYPRFNPNRFAESNEEDRKNRAVLDAYEPGSVFKPFVYALALDQKLITPRSLIGQDGGSITIGKHTISDTHTIRDLSAELMVVESSNVGAYKIVKMLGRESFYDGLQRFGFGQRTGIGLPGETAGILWKPQRWSEIQFSNIAFGQGVSVSPLQLAVAYSALANGGELLTPRLIKAIRDPDGKVVVSFEKQVRNRVISEQAAEQTLLALEKVVTEGTGKRAWVEGYRVGGKTGTAQKVDPRTRAYTNKWMANFVGVAPIDNPEIVVAVLVDEPRNSHFGGVVAAPAFAEIVAQTLPLRSVFPSKVYEGESAQFPTQFVDSLPQDGQDSASYHATAEGLVMVPSFSGMSLNEALALAQNLGLVLQPSAAGFVIEQYPAAGTQVEKDAIVELLLATNYRQSSFEAQP
jgi:cell division protein FtsI (penicillin-binding protein 3)